MKNPRLLTVISVIVFLICSLNKTHCQEAEDKCDSISRSNFFALGGKMLQSMEKHKKFPINDYLTMIKVYNTFCLVQVESDNTNNDLIMNYRNAFEKYYYPLLTRKLQIENVTPQVQKSVKYDLYVGFGIGIRCKDYYTIYN